MKTLWKFVPVAVLFSLPGAHLSAQDVDEWSAKIVMVLDESASENAGNEQNDVEKFINYKLAPLISDSRNLFRNRQSPQCYVGKEQADGKNLREINFTKLRSQLRRLQFEATPLSDEGSGIRSVPGELKSMWDTIGTPDSSLLFLSEQDSESLYFFSKTGFGKDMVLVLPSCREPAAGREDDSLPPMKSLACLAQRAGSGVESDECADGDTSADTARRNRLEQSPELRILILAFLARHLEDYTTSGNPGDKTEIQPLEWTLKWTLKHDVGEINPQTATPCNDIVALYRNVQCR